MRVLKNDIYNSILYIARQEFIKRGFKDTCMRTISKESRVGLSNMYNYFKNKDELFIAVVKPAKDELFRFITQQHSERSVRFSRRTAFGHQEEAIESYIHLIHKYNDEIRLLLFHAQESSMEDFRDELTDHITQVSNHYMEVEKVYFPNAREVSQFFIHALSSWMVSILGEIVTHNPDRQKIREFFREYFRYGYAGWCALTGIEEEAG